MNLYLPSIRFWCFTNKKQLEEKNKQLEEKKRKANYVIEKLNGKFVNNKYCDFIELNLTCSNNDVYIYNFSSDDTIVFLFNCYLTKNSEKDYKKNVDNYVKNIKIDIDATYNKIIEIEKTNNFNNSTFSLNDIVYLKS